MLLNITSNFEVSIVHLCMGLDRHNIFGAQQHQKPYDTSRTLMRDGCHQGIALLQLSTACKTILLAAKIPGPCCRLTRTAYPYVKFSFMQPIHPHRRRASTSVHDGTPCGRHFFMAVTRTLRLSHLPRWLQRLRQLSKNNNAKSWDNNACCLEESLLVTGDPRAHQTSGRCPTFRACILKTRNIGL